MKRKIFLALTLILAFALCFSLASCGDDDETVKSVEFVKGSTATEYTVGATPDFSGIQLKVTYEDDHTETVGADKLTIGTVDTSTAGEKTLTVKYGDFSVEIKITVKAAPATITGIAIVPGTAAATVKLGTVYDVSTVQVEAVYSDGTKKPIAASDLEIIAPSTAAIGEATLKVKYLTYEATLTVTVTGVSSIVVDASSVANEVYIGGVLDTSKLKVIVTYSSGETKTVERELLTIGNVDTSKIGDASLPIAYDGFTYNYPVKVYGPTSLEINESSVTKEFFVGATAEFSGIQATVYYSNNTNKTVYLRDLTLSAVSTATAGTVVLTATYETVSDTVNIAIVGVKDMSAIGLASEILVGEALNLSALKLNVTYTNNKTAILESGFTVGSFDSATKGNKTLAITYLDKTINAPVKVCGPVGIEISGVPTFVVGQKPSLSGLAVNLVYEDALATKKPVTTYTTNIDSLDFDLAADKILTVTYEGFTKDVILSTSTPRAVSLVIGAASYQKLVAINHEFVTVSTSATLNYSNGTFKTLSYAELTVVSAINTATAGEQTLKVSYTENGDTVSAEVKVNVLPVDKIEYLSGLDSKININTDLNTDNVKVRVTYTDGTNTITEQISSGITVTGYDKTVAGDQTVTISALGKTTTKVVHAKAIASLEIAGEYPEFVKAGSDVDVSGVKVIVTYTDGEVSEEIAPTIVSANKVSGVITASYTENGVTKSATANVTVCSPVGIKVTGVPTYISATNDMNEVKAALANMKVYLYYLEESALTDDLITDGYTTNVESLDFSSEADGYSQTLEVSYEDYDTVEIIISTTEPVLEDIRIDAFNALLAINKAYNYESVKVIAVYANGREDVVAFADLTIDEIDNTTAGEQTVSVTYGGKEKNFTVKVLPVDSIIYVSGLADKIDVNADLNTSNVKVRVVYTDGTDDVITEEITAGVTVTGYNKTVAGDQTVTISALGKTTTKVVHAKAIASLEIAGEYPEFVKAGSDVDVSGVKVIVTYTDGEVSEEIVATSVSADKTTGVITATYTENGVTKSATATVAVLPVTEIEYVSGLKNKLNIGEELDVSNVKVLVTYSNGTYTDHEEITAGVTVTGYDKTVAGDQTVTISALGKTTTVTVHAKAVLSIEITGGCPDYVMSGDDINTANVVIKITYTDGEEKTNVAPTSVSADNATGVITAAYTENGVTKSATATVAVLPVSSIVVNGLPDVVDYGADLGAMSITVTYSNGTYTDTKVFTGVTDATVSGFNKNSVGNQTITVTYLGKSYTHTLHVKGVTKIEIVGGTYADKLMDGFDLDLSRLEIKVTYSNGDYLQGTPDIFGASATWSQSDLVATISASLTFAGQNYTDAKTVEVLPIDSVDALNGTIPGVLFDGDTLPMDKIALTVNYVIGQRESEPDANGNTEWYDVIASYLVHVGHKNLVIIGSGDDFDATTGKWGSSGTKMLTLVFKPQDTVTDDFGITTPKWMAVAKIEIQAVEKIELVEGSMPSTVFQNENLENASTTAQFRVEYTDGTYAYVTPSTPGFNMLIPENATANPGTAVIKVSYKNSATFDITITVVSSSGSANMIFGVEKPTSITARESYKQNFTNQNNVYVVGDDNPFIFRLSLLALGADGRPAYNPEYEGVSKVYVLDENGEVVGEAGDMVIINDAKGKNSFDFADSAIGKTFKIVTAPKDAPTMTVEQIVKVVDGYNIYDAKELNYITNYDEDLDGSDYKFYVDQNGDEYGQLTAVKNFLASKNMPYVNISAAVLHGNISVTEKDLPPEYFFTYTINGVEKTGLLDYLPIYNRQFTNPNGESFSIYGNYYSIYSYQLPCVVEKGFANNVDNFSDSELFLFRGRNEEAIMANATGRKHNINQANVIDTGFRDNDPNSNDQSASARHMLGLVGLKFRTCEGNVINTNVEAFYISLFADWDNLNLNITDSNIYNAWQGHLFIFNENYMTPDDTLPGDYYQNIQVNITNSLMGKCGGPVILSQQRNGYNPLDTANPSKNLQNFYSGADVTVDEKSNLYSYVTGQEAWFVAVGATPQAANIMMLDASLKEASGGEATFTSSEKIQGVSTMNLVMIVMNSGFAPDGTYATLNDSLTIAGDKMIELGENIGGGISNSELDMVYSQLESAFESPIFQTANKLPIDPNVINIIAQSENPEVAAMAALLTDFNSTFVLNPFAVPAERVNDVGKTIEGMLNSNPDLMAAVQNYLGMTQAYDHNEDLYKEGEYISLYFGGLAVTLEYYHN